MLMDANGIRDDLPAITTFPNRLLALTIELQDILFAAFGRSDPGPLRDALTSGVGWK